MLAKEDVRVIIQEETTGLRSDVAKLKTDVSTLQADTATLKVDVAEMKTDVKELKGNMRTLLTNVDGFMKGLEREESERTSADALLERRVETLERARSV